MKSWVRIFVLGLIATGLAACGGSESVETPPEITGPALVMFYTDK